MRRWSCAPPRTLRDRRSLSPRDPCRPFRWPVLGGFTTCPPRVGLRLYACQETVLVHEPAGRRAAAPVRSGGPVSHQTRGPVPLPAEEPPAAPGPARG